MDNVEVGEIFTITEESEQEHQAEVLAKKDIDGTQYVAVGFVEDIQEESEEDIDIFFLRVDEEGDFTPLDSDEEFEKVSSAFRETI
ncbi:DUF1292 domain-containing protein [Virgibacillus sediminis]|uniref:DUF1292 domain-containing protein n=1 Tax=Virgibacillus sediminis TaxID=202260 RepID=A0ABV7A9V5_9BACI